MRKTRVKAIRAMLVAQGLAPERWRVRKFKRMYTRARQGRTHATNVGDSGGPAARRRPKL